MNLEEYNLLKSNIPSFQKLDNPKGLIEQYLKYYSLDQVLGEHFFGHLDSNGERILCHYFKQKDSKKTAILMHGYYTHSGYTIELAKHLSKSGYNLICYDMPGHGLSTGKRLEIESFSDYTKTLQDILSYFKREYISDHELISFGHSTGAIPIFDASYNGNNLGIKKSFLLAPLIKTNHFNLTKLSFRATMGFVKQVKRKFRRSSHDEKFLDFLENDPSQEKFVPSSWVKALIEWNEKFEKFNGGEQNLIVLQGDQDGTVEWKTNLETIKNKYSNSKIHLIKEAEHQLMNESKVYMDQVFSIIDNELSS